MHTYIHTYIHTAHLAEFDSRFKYRQDVLQAMTLQGGLIDCGHNGRQNVCIHTYIHTYIQVRSYKHSADLLFKRTFAFIYANMRTYTYTYMNSNYMYICMYVDCIHNYPLMYVCMYVNKSVSLNL